MTAPEHPLHIRVAEALGWRLVPLPTAKTSCQWGGGQRAWVSPEGRELCEACQSDDVPRYDTSWEATGPLIEKYKMYLYWESAIKGPGGGWIAQPSDPSGATPFTLFGPGVTPLIAACNLILALAEAGKLEER